MTRKNIILTQEQILYYITRYPDRSLTQLCDLTRMGIGVLLPILKQLEENKTILYQRSRYQINDSLVNLSELAQPNGDENGTQTN